VPADESKDTSSDRSIVVSSIAINAIPNFIDITLSGSSFDKPSSSITRCPFSLDAFYSISSTPLSGQSLWSSVPALHRLENRGLLAADWKETETGREAKFYRLTRKGLKQLETETADWQRLIDAIGLILGMADGGAQ